MEILNLLNKFHNLILDSLFPIECLGCKKTDQWLCENCLNKIQPLAEQSCPVCEKVATPFGQVCFACRNKTDLDALLVATSYQNELVSQTIHLLKYNFIQDLSTPLGKLLGKTLTSSEMPLPDLIIPVPLFPRRLRWRGFNQSEVLAQKMLATDLLPWQIPLSTKILIRIKNTKPQKELKKFSLRRQNISNAFIIKDPAAISGKTILLIDDVPTTGSTLFECAKMLKISGAKKVYALVVARQQIQL